MNADFSRSVKISTLWEIILYHTMSFIHLLKATSSKIRLITLPRNTQVLVRLRELIEITLKRCLKYF